jgi:exodeoxyribonuclease III
VLRVLTINIGAASRQRAEKLLIWLAARPEDVFILTETSAGAGTAYLLDQFRQTGYAVVNTPDDGDRGAALISRIPILGEHLVALDKVTIPARIAAAVLDTRPRVSVVGVYVPSRDRSVDKTERKQLFIGSLLDALAALPATNRAGLVLGGDYNVISRTHQPAHMGFLPFEYGLLEALAESGLIDAHAYCTPDTQPHSWIGRTGEGYQYDYFHVTRDLSARIEACTYLHETREQQLTDHAAVTLSLRADAPRLDLGDPTESDEIALF